MDVPEILHELIGVERPAPLVEDAIYRAALALEPSAAGALHVTCADETELEAAIAFRVAFAEKLLPALKGDQRGSMRLANLGGRYEKGALGIAHAHFATTASREGRLLMVVKINTHVGRLLTPGGVRYGWLDRYDLESQCCGAMHALLDGADLPVVAELRRTFRSGELDRLAALSDPARVAPPHRLLLASVVAARLQARDAVADILARPPDPTVHWLVVPAVTINQPGVDSQLVVGAYTVDGGAASATPSYRGLGDDPSRYVLTETAGTMALAE